MLWLALLTAVAAQAAPAPEGSQIFPSRVELVAVELIVVDGQGRPVRDLVPAEFRVEVAGRPRRVATAEFVVVAQEPDEPPPVSTQGFSTNETVRPGRLVLLVVDTSSIDMGKGRVELEAAKRMLDRLGPTDRVGLLTIPSSGPREEFTTDHERIRGALGKIVGRARMAGRRLSLGEALACSENEGTTSSGRCAQAIERACGRESRTVDVELCRQEVLAEAWQLASSYRQSSTESRGLLQATFEALARVEGQKVVVLVSQGLGLPDVGAHFGGAGLELRQLASAAAAARVALYVVPVASRSLLASIDSDVPPEEVALDSGMRFFGLESLAVEARGAVLRGEPGRAFERVLSETSGYYRLGFEPEGDDRNGKPRKLKVTVTRPGLVVRARPSVVFPTGGPERPGEAVLVAALRSPTLATGLPVRVASWTLAGDVPGKVRVLIRAEIGGQAEAPGLAVGYVLLAEGDKVVASASQSMRDDAVTSGPIPYSASLTVAPGAYTLRLAARDGRGRLGSVEHPLEASLVQAGSVALSDLLLGHPPAPGAAFRPAIAPETRGESLAVQAEITGASEALESVSARLEVVSDETGVSLSTTPAALSPEAGRGRRIAQAATPVGRLAPGAYLARIVVSSGGAPLGAVTRPFRVLAP